MNLEEEALKEVVERIAGKAAVVLVPMLRRKSNIDEFKLASKAKMTINELRNILYKLHHYDLVSSIRKKDKKKGWFIYYWTLNEDKALRLLIKLYEAELKEQKDILENIIKKNYFICPQGHVELSEESALEQNFECVECGELLVLKDREAAKRNITKTIEKIEEKISELNKLLEKYEKKLEKARKKLEIKERKEKKRNTKKQKRKKV